MSFIKIFSLLFLSVLFFNFSSCFVWLDFKLGNYTKTILNLKKNFELTNIVKALMYNSMYTIVEMGTPKQNVVIDISPKGKGFYFDSLNCQSFYNNYNQSITFDYQNYGGYNANLSETFKIMKDTHQSNSRFLSQENFAFGYYSKNFKDKEIKENSGTQCNFNNLDILYINNTNEPVCGIIGLALRNEISESDSPSFLDQIKKYSFVNGYYWSFIFRSNTDGYLLIGEAPHVFEPTYYKENDFIEVYTANKGPKGNDLIWEIDFDEVFSQSEDGNKNYISQEVNKGEINFSSNGIKGTRSYYNFILTNFFQNYLKNGTCVVADTDQTFFDYDIIYCDKEKFEFNNTIQKFPDLHFKSKDYNMEFKFTYKELFKLIGNQYYFLIYFQDSSTDDVSWEIGVPFLKKYQLIFNSDTKRIGLYKNQVDDNSSNKLIEKIDKINGRVEKNESKNNEGSSFWKKVFTIRTLIEVLIGIALIAGLVFLGMKLYNKRKKKANELEDDYEYNTTGEPINN